MIEGNIGIGTYNNIRCNRFSSSELENNNK